jgi:hypothetical protein
VCGGNNSSNSGVVYAVHDLGAQLCGPEFLSHIREEAFLTKVAQGGNVSIQTSGSKHSVGQSSASLSSRHSNVSSDGFAPVSQKSRRDSNQELCWSSSADGTCAVMILDALDRTEQIRVSNALIEMFQMLDTEPHDNRDIAARNMDKDRSTDDDSKKAGNDGDSDSASDCNGVKDSGTIAHVF